MRIIIARERNTIQIGRTSENDALTVRFDVRDWPELYGAGGSFVLVHQRPGDAQPYVCAASVALDGYLDWIVTAVDVEKIGAGEAQLTYVFGETIAKSVIFKTQIQRSLGQAGELPEPYEDKIDELIERSAEITVDAERAEDARDDAVAQALKSEGYAIGQQNGEAVGEGSPYRNNNAKYFKEQADQDSLQASQKADAAALQALKAEGFATGKQAGSEVGDGSPYYQNNAKYYKEQAAGSATSAAGSAQEATRQAGLANEDRQAIEDMTVSQETLEPGAEVDVQKTVNPVTGVVNLHFAIPQGDDYHLTSEDKQDIAGIVEEDTDIFQEETGLSIKELVATICGYVQTIAAFVEYTGDTELSDSSEMWVQNKVITAAIAAINQALQGKQATLTFDDAPTQGSNNPVKSGGIYSAVKTLDDNIKAGTEEMAAYHLGFYLDGDGNVCQKEG